MRVPLSARQKNYLFTVMGNILSDPMGEKYLTFTGSLD
jgi:hypothetical protein